MSRPVLRDGWYYCRVRVPHDIVGTFARTSSGKLKQELWEPLNTRSSAEAKRRLAAVSAGIADRFAAHRSSTGIGVLPGPQARESVAVTMADEPFYSIRDAQRWYAENLDCVEMRYRVLTTTAAEHNLDAFWRGEIIDLPPGLTRDTAMTTALATCYRAHMQRRLKTLQDELEIGDFDSIQTSVGQVFQKWPDTVPFLVECARAQIDYMESRLRRPGSVVYALSFEEPQKATEANTVPLFSAALARWRPIKVRQKGWDEGGRMTQLLDTAATLLIDICGDKPLTSYSKNDVADFTEVLARLPPHRSKKSETKHLSAREAAALGLPPINLKTANDYISRIGDLYDWAKKTIEGVDHNPFAEATFPIRSDQRDEKHAFSPDDLKAIFAGLKRADDAKFWAPILALYTGCRSNEILKLKATDVRREDGSGLWYLDINEDAHKSLRIHHTLKRSSHKRRIPVHRDLVSFGFLRFVKRCKTERLFPEREPDSFGKFSDAFGKWFNRYLKSVGVKRSKLDFHSFRHSFVDACDGRMPDDIIRRLKGDARGGTLDRYGQGKTEIEILAEHLAKLKVKGLDLSHLGQDRTQVGPKVPA